MTFFSFGFAFLRSMLWDWEYSWHSYTAELEIYLEKNEKTARNNMKLVGKVFH